jgi:DNA-directed RNA polymerase subunit RPC12/RpoP
MLLLHVQRRYAATQNLKEGNVILNVIGLLSIMLLVIALAIRSLDHGFFCWKCDRWVPNGPMFADDRMAYVANGCPRCGELPIAPTRCRSCGHDSVYPRSLAEFHCRRWTCGDTTYLAPAYRDATGRARHVFG